MILRTLHSKLLVAIVLITMTSMCVLGFISYKEQRQLLNQQIDSDLHFASESISGEINEFIYERLSDIDLLRRNPILINEESTPAQIKEQFFDFIASHDKYFYGSILLNEKGIVVADMGDGMIGKDLSERSWVSKANDAGVYFSDIYMSPIIHKPLVVLTSRVDNKEGKHIGTVSTSLDLDAFWKLIDRFSKSSTSAKEGQIAFLINHKGEILAHPDRSQVFNNNFFEHQGVNEVKFLEALERNQILTNNDGSTSYIFSQIDHVTGFNNNWFVVISSPTKILNEPLEQLLKEYLVIFLLALVASVIISILLTKYFTRPINKLIGRVTLFGKGEKPQDTLIKDYKEVEQLSASFNLMMDQIVKRENEHRKASTILETTDYGVLSIDYNNNKVTTYNTYCENLFSVPKDEVIGKSITELDTKINRFVSSLQFEAFNSSKKMHEKLEINIELHERLHTFNVSISRISPRNALTEMNDILITFTDVTEQRVLEKEILHSEKLNAIGQMAAGIAHEIRNPLTTIKGFLELNENESSFKDYKPLLLKEIERINAILQSMLNISKPKISGKRVTTDINQTLDETLLLFVNSFKNNQVTVMKNFANLPTITVNDDYLRQVFFNMFQNACEAMANGGVLTITTSYNANEFMITISDTGIGMKEDTINQLATPFFTTKKQGNGLGLMICYRIIEDLGGKIDVNSEINKGTEFTIRLPR